MDSRTRAALDPVASKFIDYISNIPMCYAPIRGFSLCQTDETGLNQIKNYIQEETQ